MLTDEEYGRKRREEQKKATLRRERELKDKGWRRFSRLVPPELYGRMLEFYNGVKHEYGVGEK